MIKLKDCEILDIDYEKDYISGCPTCNAGSVYTTYINFWTGDKIVFFEAVREYEYLASLGDILVIILNNLDTMAEMTFEEFIEWFKDEIYSTACYYQSSIKINTEVDDCNTDEWEEIARRG